MSSRSEDAADATLPRTQSGATPQHLLTTLLGHYWFNRTEQLPSAALVDLLAEFDISEPSARAALSRLVKRGALVSSKRGRNTYYGLNPAALPQMQANLERVVAFGTRASAQWDQRWTMVAFSVPEAQRQLRHTVRTRLKWLGFAALYDGLWCSPWEERDAPLAMLAELGIDQATVMRAEIDPRSTRQALAAWDLDEVRERYRAFEDEFAPLLAAVRNGALTSSQTLVERTKLLDRWRLFPALEPDLPTELLPEDWPRTRLRGLFVELYDTLAPVAIARCQQIIANHAPELASLVAHPPFEPSA